MRCVISSGHGLFVRGASGYLDEVNEARQVVNRVGKILNEAGHPTQIFHDDTSKSQSVNLSTIVDYHNKQPRDLDISIHFNAYQTTSKPMGTEVLYVTQSSLAAKVSAAIAKAGSFLNRGAKKRTDLTFLNKTNKPAILIEVCFVDSSADANLYRQGFESICQAIAESVAGEKLPSEPPVIEPSPPVEPPFTGDNRVYIISTASKGVRVLLNGEHLSGDETARHSVDLTVTLAGAVVFTIDGQDFHNFEEGGEEIPSNQSGITATVFGGKADYNTSAYDPSKVLNDTDLYIALPYKFRGERPKVIVTNCDTGSEATAEIWDVGPWLIDDAYWDVGDRPVVEVCYADQVPLSSGPNAGKVPTNDAAIDLSPALAKLIGITGKGKVNWKFV
jgi:N-acetylmuramoyl-L-alanine amidase